MKITSIKNVVAIGIGSAIFYIIGTFIRVPVLIVPNTAVQFQFCVQSLFSLLFGPFVGFLIGFIGHTLIDAYSGYGIWWTWIIPSGCFGFIIGLFRNRFKIANGIFELKDIIRFVVIQIITAIFIWGFMAPVGDIFVGEPAKKAFAQGIVSALLNGFSVSVTGVLLLVSYARTRTKSGSLSKD